MSAAMKLLAVVTTLLLAVTAQAQSYIRPSKGATITAYEGENVNTAGVPINLPVIEFSSFSSVIVEASNTYRGVYGSNCYWFVGVEGATAPAGPFTATIISDPNTYRYQFAVGAFPNIPYRTLSYAVSNVPRYIRFTVNLQGFGQPACDKFTLKITPIPFAIREEISGSVSSASPFPTNAAPVIIGGQAPGIGQIVLPLKLDGNGYMPVGRRRAGGTGLTPSGYTTGIMSVGVAPTEFAVVTGRTYLQNQSTQTVYCGYGLGVSTTSYSYALPPCTVAKDGTSPLIEMPAENFFFAAATFGPVRCVVAAGTADVSVLEYL